MAEIDSLLVKIQADTSSLRGELAKATAAMAKSMQAMAKESERLNNRGALTVRTGWFRAEDCGPRR